MHLIFFHSGLCYRTNNMVSIFYESIGIILISFIFDTNSNVCQHLFSPSLNWAKILIFEVCQFSNFSFTNLNKYDYILSTSYSGEPLFNLITNHYLMYNTTITMLYYFKYEVCDVWRINRLNDFQCYHVIWRLFKFRLF